MFMNLLSIILLNAIFDYEQAQSFILLNTRTYWKQVGTATKNRDTSIYMSKNHDNEQNIVNENSVVEVLVHQHFPNFFSPTAAKKSWLSFVWRKGGGLPIFVIARHSDISETKEEVWLQDNGVINNFKSYTADSRRLLLPLFMEEKLLYMDNDDDDEKKDSILQYMVTDAGLLSSEIIPSSHVGTVTFSSTNEEGLDIGGTFMTWVVKFRVTNPSRRNFWQLFTRKMIIDTSNNFSAFAAAPTLYTRRTILRNNVESPPLTPQLAMTKWIEFCWKEGGGMPFPPPITFDQNVSQVRIIIPPFLKERIVSMSCSHDDTDDRISKGHNKTQSYCELLYTVDNPSIATYQVHTHSGRIRFLENLSEANTVDMIWEIEIRPYYSWLSFVKIFTSAIVSSYAKNFKCHLLVGPETMVPIKLPRGIGEEVFLQIRKDSWLGGVLDAHLTDGRSTIEQSLSMLQPWTWGRVDEDGEEESWSR